MAEMEDKLNEILGNEQAMSQIMSIAQSITGGNHDENSTSDLGYGMDTGSGANLMPLEGLMDGLDPKFLAMGMRLVTAYQSQHRSMELMTALRPFVSDKRHDMMERLSTATKIAKVGSVLVTMWKEEIK